MVKLLNWQQNVLKKTVYLSEFSLFFVVYTSVFIAYTE